MITKRPEVCVPYLYMQMRKVQPFILKTEKGGGPYIIVSKRTLHFKYFQNKQRQMKKD